MPSGVRGADPRRNALRRFDERAEDAWSSGYDWRSGSGRVEPAFRAPYEYLERRLGEGLDGALVLDYGCGQGIHTVYPAKRGAHVVGIDLSAAALAVATERARREGVAHRCAFVRGDGERLPFRGATFDGALAVGVLSYVGPAVAYAELARVLRPGGRAVVVDTLRHNPAIAAHRWLRVLRGSRTAHEASRAPSLGDLTLAARFFKIEELRCFDLLTALAAPVIRSDAIPWLWRTLRAADERLLRSRLLRVLAFKFACVLRRP